MMKYPLLVLFLIAIPAMAWEIGPFNRASVNPLITPLKDSLFFCSIQNKDVTWESDHTFNPAAIVRNDKIYLFYRAEDNFGQGIGRHISRIGLAISSDGFHFTRFPEPIFFPDFDNQYEHEWPGGCEDPRIVEREDGTYIMTYTQWNQKIAVLGIASSTDLLQWKKHGYAFENEGRLGKRWSKSGSIVCKYEGERLIATKIWGKYWMYWGEKALHVAISDDLINWEPFLDKNGNPIAILLPRPGKYDSELIEPGPPAVLTEKGIVLIYNGKNSSTIGDPYITAGAYCPGQLLLDAYNPTKVIAQTEDCFFTPEMPYELNGQYLGGTFFAQGLVRFHGRWLLYYGGADSNVGVAFSNN